MKMNKIALACGIALLGASATATAELSMNIGATSNYIWRGTTQTANGSAISGGLDWGHESGVYVGTWASNAWDDYELDLYGGYATEFGDFGVDAGLIYYTYSEDADSNFLELGLSGSFKFITAGVNYTLSSDIDDTKEEAEGFIEGDLYYYVSAGFDLPQDFSIGLTVGAYTFEDDGVNETDLDYTHYQVDLTKSAGDYGDVTLSLSDTDLEDGEDEEGNEIPGEDADLRFFVSWSKSF
jgi:uncharacterized protein (TIGR02001 family)